MFRKKQTLGLRLWHWANSATIGLLLLSVVLRNIFLNVRTNKGVLISKAQALGVVLSEQQAIELAREVREQIWQWHPIIGFVAIALLIFRLAVYFLNKSTAVKSTETAKQYIIVKKVHTVFYIVLAVMGITGCLMYWDDFFHLTKSMDHFFQEVHENLMWFIIIFTVAHIVGVVKSEFGVDKGIVSDMINGG